MSFESELRTYILSIAAITNLIDDRVYPQLVPYAADISTRLPCIVYSLDDIEPTFTHDAAGAVNNRYYGLEAWALKYDTMVELADAILEALGVLVNTELTTLTVTSCFIDGLTDMVQPSPDNDQQRIYGRAFTLHVKYK